MYRVLLDQGLPRTTALVLSKAGVDAVHVGNIGLAEASDQEVLETADREDRVCFTLDADFHKLLATSQSSRPSVVRIRIEGLRAGAMAELILTVLKEAGPKLEEGAAVTVTKRAIRTRRLPLGKPKT